MPTISDIIGDIIQREGPPTNDPLDPGGRTAYGISERANPSAWADGVVTEAEARAIYERKYVIWPGFDKIHDPRLQAQLIDFGVTSGSNLAIMKLQEILGTKIDGILGNQTLTALNQADPKVINNKLVISRIKMVCRLVQKRPTDIKFLSGWISRSCDFFL